MRCVARGDSGAPAAICGLLLRWLQRSRLPCSSCEWCLFDERTASHRCRCVPVMNTRRQFLIRAPLGFLTASVACRNEGPSSGSQSAPATPGAPPTFGTGPGSGPAVSPATFAEAEKLMQVTMTAAERQQAADSWRQSMAPYLERRTGPRKVAIARHRRAGHALESDASGHRGAAVARPVRALEGRRRAAAVVRRRHRLRAGDAAVAMDRVAAAHVASGSPTSISSRIERLDGKIRSVITADARTTRSRARRRPTPRSPPASIAARCTASPTA